jgi:hypothetical protein
MSSLSNVLGPAAALAPLVRRQCRNRQCVDFIADELAKALIYQLMPGNKPLAIKFLGDDQGAIMSVVVTLDFDHRVAECGLD